MDSNCNNPDGNNLSQFNTFNSAPYTPIKNNDNGIIMEEEDNTHDIAASKVKITNEGEWKEDIRTSCMNIFCNFAKFNNEDKDFYLSHQNLCKILRTVNLLDSNFHSKSFLKMSDVDMMLKKVNPNGHKLSGKQFMNLIVLLSAKIDEVNFLVNKKLSVLKIIKTFFEPFSNYIEDKNINQGEKENSRRSEGDNKNIFYHKQIENNLLSMQLDNLVLLVFNSVYNGLYYIFHSYFHYEVNKFTEVEKILKGSLNSLLEFCKDFEITPFVLTADKVAIYYNLIIELDQSELITSEDKFIFEPKKDKGNIFSMSKFAIFLNQMALMSFDKYSKYIESNKESNIKDDANRNLYLLSPRMLKQENINQSVQLMKNAEKLIFFFERIEFCSKGREQLEKRNHKPSNCKMNLIPPIEVISLIDPKAINVLRSPSEISVNMSSNNMMSSQSLISIKSKPRLVDNYNINATYFSDFRNFLSVKNEEVLDKFYLHHDTFKEIFETYAQIGDKFNNIHMSLSAFKRFLKDCNLIYQPENKSSFASDKSLIASSVRSVIKQMSKSPIPSSKSNYSSSINILDQKSLSKKSSVIVLKEKLTEQDICIIFYDLTGVKNFDNSEKIKPQFNRNKGFPLKFEECTTSINMGNFIDGRKVSTKSVLPLKLNFQLFLRSFELLACKMHINMNLDDAVARFIDFDIAKMIKDHTDTNYITVKNNLMEALSYLKKEEIIDVMKELNAILIPHFINYADKIGLMTFDSFFAFYKDFSVFPDIVNLIQLKSIFFTLADFFKTQLNSNYNTQFSTEKLLKSASKIELKPMISKISNDSQSNSRLKHILSNKEALNFELFIDSLALAALHSKTHEDCNEIEKIMQLADKMSQSKGINKSQLKSGQTFNSNIEFNAAIISIKEKMPNLFEKKKDLHEMLRSPTCFDDIFDGE